MTQIAALANAFLNGETISIMDGFKKFGITNVPREVGRAIERKFGVIITKSPTDFTSRYGQKGFYYKYRLPRIQQNEDGIKKMQEYLLENGITPQNNTNQKSFISQNIFS